MSMDSSPTTAFKQVAIGIPIGALLGYASQTSGAFAPEVIRAQFTFQNQILAKFFLAACAGSALSMIILHLLFNTSFSRSRASKGWGRKGAITAILGGFCQGVGMALAGACPGMAYAQLGSRVINARWLYTGGVIGAFVYGYVQPLLMQYHAIDFKNTLGERFKSINFDRQWFKSNFVIAAGLFGSMVLSLAIAINARFPWIQEIKTVTGIDPTLAMNPILAGFSIGLLQIPTFLFLNHTLLRMSSGYADLASQLYRILPVSQSRALRVHPRARSEDEYRAEKMRLHPHLNIPADNEFRTPSTQSIREIGFGIGAIIGAAYASRNVHAVMPHVSIWEALIGGFLIVFGARFAGGCTSGHGVTGLASMNIMSWITIPSMIAGAVLTGNVMNVVYGSDAYLLKS